jgi:hypothetical protein
MNNKTEGM